MSCPNDLIELCSVQFFASYTNLLKSSNYVTRRQSLKVHCLCMCLVHVVAMPCYHTQLTVMHVVDQVKRLLHTACAAIVEASQDMKISGSRCDAHHCSMY